MPILSGLKPRSAKRISSVRRKCSKKLTLTAASGRGIRTFIVEGEAVRRGFRSVRFSVSIIIEISSRVKEGSWDHLFRVTRQYLSVSSKFPISSAGIMVSA